MSERNTITPSLIVMAAGIGSRYGGLKQIDPVGPGGEAIIDYTVYDAMRAGFGKIIFVIRRDIEEAFRQAFGKRFESRCDVHYVFQEMNSLPSGFTLPPERKKPWGTAHAVLTAEKEVSEPFGVANADDFYGYSSFRVLSQFLRDQCSPQVFTMVGYILRNTLSEHGSVSRGLCKCNSQGYLESVTEITKIEKDNSAAKYTDAEGQSHPLSGDEIVSMNLWGFHPALMNTIRKDFSDFLRENIQNIKAELYIPTVINSMLKNNLIQLKVLQTRDSWFGVTYPEDKPTVKACIRELIDRGDYPERLWE